ncbi:transmembrane protein 63 [Choristoneura fumiferana]|uniref:transmembrane protein 63 n=1 Tax=Choristoneura fumiferana TaxID=7141 RepID=UPI003D153E19
MNFISTGAYTLVDNSSDENCMLVNQTHSSFITNAYNGIPQTLILNVIAWVFLIALFTVLRRTAWNYGRMALVQRSKSRWTNLFYRRGDGDALVERRHSVDEALSIDQGFLAWLPAVFKVTREQVLAKCGPDAVHYLSFQRHAITLMFIVTLISIGVILPINFQGTNLNVDIGTFSRTTLSNLNGKSAWLWVHTIICILFLPLSILIMRRCTGRKPATPNMTGTIMISNISRADRNDATIRAYFAHNFPHIAIVDLRLAYNINHLNEVQEKREMVSEALSYSDTYFKKTGKRITVKPALCGPELDALEFYTNEEKRLKDEAKRCRAIVFNDPLGIAFLTLPSYQLAEHVMNHFTLHRGWVLSHATNPTDIIWENLSVQPGIWYLKAFVVNVFLFIVLFFLTTPAIIVNLFNNFKIESTNKIGSVIFEFLPTLLLWTMAAVMPAIVAFSDKFLSHWTKSQQNYSIMTKTVSYLLLMTLILPSLGFASAEALMLWTLVYHKNDTMRWDCVFLPDKGAFFVNYVITSGFIGTAMELVRFPELFLYVWYLLQSKSKAEKSYVKKAILYEFPFGVHYAWSLAIFSITMVYSLACPLISPFGLVYFMFKHIGDKHNLYFAYGPSDMSGVGGGRIHSTAVRLIRVSVVLLLINMAAWAALRAGLTDARTIILIMAAIVAFGTFLLLSPFPSCTPPAPLQEESSIRFQEYVAPVLAKPLDATPITTPTTPNYGASSPVINHAYSPGPINI